MVVASGPLTSDPLAQEISRITGSDRLYFYDSISPIVAADSIDMSIAFRASRYGKSLDGSDDYINCPFNKDQYNAFIDALLAGRILRAAHSGRQDALLRRLPAHRGNRPPRTRYLALGP